MACTPAPHPHNGVNRKRDGYQGGWIEGKRRMKPEQTRRSKGRWYVLVLISLMYLITYLDRVNISTAAPVISKEFGFDKITMGVIFSAFGWAYAMFQVPGGWLGDRFGARNVLTVIVGCLLYTSPSPRD